MKTLKIPVRLAILPLVILLTIGVGTVLAQSGDPEDAEGGVISTLDRSISSNDEEVVQQAVDDPQAFLQSDGEGQPDAPSGSSAGGEVELTGETQGGLTQFFKRSAGSNFNPRSSVTAYSYAGGGCMKRDSNTGDSWFTIDLQVPEGAEIDFLRVYYYDNDATYNINSELWVFDGAGGTTLIAEADSSGAPGYSSTGSDFFSHIVDNTNETLVVVASIQGGVGANLQLCGIRIRYQYNLSGGFLPAVLNVATP